MVILLGKTATGKDTIINKLVNEHGFKKLITYTTRPARKGEENGITYHFISEDNFKQKIKDDFFAEWKTYDTEFGTWYYGTALEDLQNADDKTVIILTPDGLKDIKDRVHNIFSIYIFADNNTIVNRLIRRGDNPNEANRRLQHDNDDFLGIENIVDTIIFNNKETKIDKVVARILESIERS